MSYELTIAKAVYKLSSALENLDSINNDSSVHFKGQFKRDFAKFFNYFVHHTNDIATAMIDADVNNWNKAVYEINADFEECVEADSEELKHIGLMLVKMRSCVIDLKGIEKTVQSKIVAAPLLNVLGLVLSRGYIKKLPIGKSGMEKLLEQYSKEIGSLQLN